MDWHEAFMVQARSEHAVMTMLDKANVAPCHRLHYLQMVTEKLAKAVITPRGDRVPAPPTSHVVFVRMLQVIRTNRSVRQALGFKDAKSFRAYIRSLFGIAGEIEQLSPEQAGLTRPNPEYPWREAADGPVTAPVRYAFPGFHRDAALMVKIERLVDDLLRVMN